VDPSPTRRASSGPEPPQACFEERLGFDRAAAQLRTGAKRARREAAATLRKFGALAVEPLGAALRDRDLQVRIAAASSLGKIGDARAVEPLGRALRHGATRRPGWHLAISVVIVAAAAAAWVGIALGFAALEQAALVIGCGSLFLAGVVSEQFQAQRARGRLLREIATSLARISAAGPAPELRSLVPDLRRVSSDWLQQDEQTRRISREAAQRIETLTSDLKSLPVPVRAPGASEGALPRPADNPASEGERLPRVSPGDRD